METSTQPKPGHTRVFRVPVHGTIPGAPFRTGPTELELTLREGARQPERVVVRFRPGNTEFQLKLMRWAKAERLTTQPALLSLQAHQAQPVIEYAADATLLARSKGGFTSEAELQAYLAEIPPMLNWQGYRLDAIAFETRR